MEPGWIAAVALDLIAEKHWSSLQHFSDVGKAPKNLLTGACKKMKREQF